MTSFNRFRLLLDTPQLGFRVARREPSNVLLPQFRDPKSLLEVRQIGRRDAAALQAFIRLVRMVQRERMPNTNVICNSIDLNNFMNCIEYMRYLLIYYL